MIPQVTSLITSGFTESIVCVEFTVVFTADLVVGESIAETAIIDLEESVGFTVGPETPARLTVECTVSDPILPEGFTEELMVPVVLTVSLLVFDWYMVGFTVLIQFSQLGLYSPK